MGNNIFEGMGVYGGLLNITYAFMFMLVLLGVPTVLFLSLLVAKYVVYRPSQAIFNLIKEENDGLQK